MCCRKQLLTKVQIMLTFKKQAEISNHFFLLLLILLSVNLSSLILLQAKQSCRKKRTLLLEQPFSSAQIKSTRSLHDNQYFGYTEQQLNFLDSFSHQLSVEPTCNKDNYFDWLTSQDKAQDSKLLTSPTVIHITSIKLE